MWIVLGIRNSVSIENILLAKYIKLKDLGHKNEAQIGYVRYRKSLSILLKQSGIFLYCTIFLKTKLMTWNYMVGYDKIGSSTYLPKSHAPPNLSFLCFIKVWSLRLVGLRFWSFDFTFRKAFGFLMVSGGMKRWRRSRVFITNFE